MCTSGPHIYFKLRIQKIPEIYRILQIKTGFGGSSSNHTSGSATVSFRATSKPLGWESDFLSVSPQLQIQCNSSSTFHTRFVCPNMTFAIAVWRRRIAAKGQPKTVHIGIAQDCRIAHVCVREHCSRVLLPVKQAVARVRFS